MTPVTEHVKIYLAARYNGHRADPRSNNPNQQAAASEKYPYLLESYHYVGKNQYAEVIRYNGDNLFMDSGAFSMFTLGAEVNLDHYGDYLRLAADHIHVASNVDAIGAGREADSYANQKYLESLGLPVPVCPVHHARDDDRWLVKYIDEGYPYIFLGGMVPESTPYLIDWLDHIWDKYLALPDGTARVKVHGFGLTTFELMERYPWFSVDSTSWVMQGMFGNIKVKIDGKVRDLAVSRRGAAAKQADRSFWSLDAHTQGLLRQQIEAKGFDLEQLADMYGMRDKWNIRFFREYMPGVQPILQRKQVTFF